MLLEQYKKGNSRIAWKIIRPWKFRRQCLIDNIIIILPLLRYKTRGFLWVSQGWFLVQEMNTFWKGSFQLERSFWPVTDWHPWIMDVILHDYPMHDYPTFRWHLWLIFGHPCLSIRIHKKNWQWWMIFHRVPWVPTWDRCFNR